jgi:hypothetical protein
MAGVILAGFAAGLLSAKVVNAFPPTERTLEAFNVVWDSPGRDASGSMPIGNGVVGLNVWVEQDGDLLFYVARVDAWSECERLLKLGRVRVSFSPNPFVKGKPFRQSLLLREGRIAVTAGDPGREVDISLVVDAGRPDILLECHSAAPVEVTAAVESWRAEKRELTDPAELESAWVVRDAPAEVRKREAWESADVFGDDPRAVVWYHRNEHSVVPLTLAHQGLAGIAGRFHDPLLQRTFGGRMTSPELRKTGPGTMSGKDLKRATIRIATHSAQTGTVSDWIGEIRKRTDSEGNPDAVRKETAAWWEAFWSRSWIFVDGDPGPQSLVTRSYILQRWMIACASRGSFPPKFNGSIFTVEPKFTEGQPFNADWRKWGGCYWWQNTRLPYYPMLASGDFDLMSPLFDFYESVAPGCRARAGLYYRADGVYFPETMTTFGTYGNADYGWDRTGKEPSVVDNPWWRWAWQQSLELADLMLDYAAYSGDVKFLAERALPMAGDALRYYDTRFGRDGRGRLRISPAQALETYQRDVTNDMPSVAGLRTVCDALLSLPPGIGTPEDRAFWQRMSGSVPDLPNREIGGHPASSPAEKFLDKRSNVETPELYGVFPFRTTGLGKPGFAPAVEAYRHRVDRSHVGWTQDGLFAALLGLTDDAREDLVARSRNSNSAFRFPAMWGPNFDWLPDQDHGSNLMTLLQLMLIQCDGDRIRLLPAWPRKWNVSFKLHAPKRTTVECVFRNGAVERLVVNPDSRRADVVLDLGAASLSAGVAAPGKQVH